MLYREADHHLELRVKPVSVHPEQELLIGGKLTADYALHLHVINLEKIHRQLEDLVEDLKDPLLPVRKLHRLLSQHGGSLLGHLSIEISLKMPLLEHVSVAPDRIVALGFGILKQQGLVAVFLLVIIIRKIFVHFSLVRKFGHRLLAIAGVHEMRPSLDDLLEELAYGLEHLGSALMMRLYQCLPPG